ncbi:MAG: protein kinase [Oscillospiraceae bacterium]|nr:protein kinase [Oscillospiraceae bacterium]
MKENNITKEPAPFPPEFSERYRALECFSHNEICETYLIESLENGREYVAKIYERFFAEGGADERKILSELDHPAVPKLIDSFETAEHIYVIREYIEGETLEKTRIPAGERFVLNVGTRLCDALTYLHTRTPPIIHRDIKPQNVIIDGENKISLIDFGIARRFSGTSEKDTHLVASDGYSPPEQYGYKQTDGLSDIYSLGIMLCWLLTGSSDTLETESLKNRALARVVRKCAAFDPKNRYKTAEAVKTALLRACNKSKLWRAAALWAAAALMLAGGFILGRITAPVKEIVPPPPIQEGVIFKEPLIEAAARLALDLGEEDEITQEQLYLIREIHIENNRVFRDTDDYHQNHADPDYNAVLKPPIASLEDLRFMPYLDTVRIGFQNITSIEPLSELTQLRVLGFLHNAVSDFSPLQSLNYLHSVDITGAPITDLSPFYEIPNLERLVLNGCARYEPSQLLNLPGNVKSLHILGYEEAYKYLPDNQFFSLTLCNSGFDSLDYVRPFSESLRELWVYGTELSSLDGIEEFTGLEVLSINQTRVSDLSPLLSLPNLRYIEVSESMRGAVEAIEDRAGLEIVFAG